MFATDTLSSFGQLVLALGGCFSHPSAQSFETIAWGWINCLGRRTMTQVISCAGERARKTITSYNRFFSKSSWSFEEIWRVVVTQVVVPLVGASESIQIAVDDTTARRWGRSIAFAGYFRDALRSTKTRHAMHWSHNWVVACVLLRLPFWPTRVISLPIWAGLFRREADCKGVVFKSRVELALEMIRKARAWIPERKIIVVGDGAFASSEMIQQRPPGVHFVSRLRRDAALNAVPPGGRRKGSRGHPLWKGPRLGTPAKIAEQATFASVDVLQYGERRKRLLHTFVALWYHVAKRSPLRVVIVRDPEKIQPDDFFLTTDLEMTAAAVAEVYAARWGIEEAFREAKQLMGFQRVHGWSPKTVERQAPFALLMLTLLKVAHVRVPANQKSEAPLPTHAMLLSLRLAEWGQQISSWSISRAESQLFERRLTAALASVA